MTEPLRDVLALTSAAYRREPLPSATDHLLSEALGDLLSADSPRRMQAVRSFSDPEHATLATFAERMAIHAVRTGSRRPIALGLAALALIKNPSDVRDYLVVLPLLHRSAVLVGANPQALFMEAATLDQTEMAGAIRIYGERNSVPSIEEMGYVEEGIGPTFRYVLRL